MFKEYYSNYGALTPDEYFQKYILDNKDECARFQYIVENIPLDIKSILDIGCGCGLFLNLLTNKFFLDSLGIEYTHSKLIYAKNKMNINVIAGNAGFLPTKDLSFDIITSQEVLEHLPYRIYENTINEIQRVAKKYILITVPFEETRHNSVCPYCGCKFNNNSHLRSYNEKNLSKLFENFDVIKTEKFGIRENILMSNLFSRYINNNRKFPLFAVCPLCGYRESTNDTPKKDSKIINNTRIVKTFTKIVPKIKKYRWIMCLFQRKIN